MVKALCIKDPQSSDSSMVDEYIIAVKYLLLLARVQIPLWSMNTPASTPQFFCLPGSDSSMVDEYGESTDRGTLRNWVQIPLWSMNTSSFMTKVWSMLKFRFLYGR